MTINLTIPTSSVSQALSAYQTNNNIAALSIADSSVQIAANIDALNIMALAGKIVGITQTGSITPLTISAPQLVNDIAVLNAITNIYTLTISDTASSVLFNISTLESNLANIASIELVNTSTPTLTISSSQLQLYLSVFSKITSNYTITLTDTNAPTLAALVYSDYNTDLTVLNKISSAYSLTVSAVSATNIASVLGNSHVSSITVSDSAANLAANLASNTPTLSTSITKITAITVSDSATLTLTLTAAQLTSYKNVLNLISTNGGTLNLTVTGVTLANLPSVFATTGVSHIAILDTAANVFSSSNLSSLLNDVTKISAITLSDTVTPTLTLTATTQSILTTDAAVLALINSSFKVAGVAAGSVANLLSTYSHIASVTVTDSLANVISNENALLTSQTTGITLSPLPTTAAALVYSDYNTDLTVLNKISSAYSLTVSAVSATNIASVLGNSHVSSITVSDSAANLAANLASNTPTLSTSITKITAITVSDSATLTLTLTAAQLTSYKNVLNLISTNGGTLNLTVTGVTLANLPSVFATTGVSHIAILDTAANVFSSSNLSSLLNDVTKISAITLSDTVTPTLTLTATTQSILTTDAAVLALINSSFKVAGVAAGSVANLLSTYSHIASVTVTDSLANVISNENALLTSQTTGITLSPLPTTAAALVYSDYNTDLTVLNKISSAYSLTVSAVSATNIASVLGNSHVSSITVSDSAANLAANLASNTPTLSTSITKITAITVSDSATLTLTLTAAQLTSYKNVLNLISTNGGTLNLTVTGVTLANLPSVFATTGVSHIAILDTAANVFSSSNLSSLLNDVTKISAITLSDTVTPTLTLTATTQSILTTDAAVLALINSSFKVAGVAAGSVANLLSTYSHIASVTVTDSLANVISNENALLTSQTTGITLSPLPTTAAALVYSDYNTDLTVLNKISSAYSLTVSAVSATNIASVLGNSHVSSITVSDSAANLAANLASNTPTLSTSITKITAITVSDSATLTLTLTAAQLTSYKNVLNLISTNGGTLNLTVTGVTLANLPSVFATTGVSHIAILDTAANVFSSSNLSSLLNDVTKISAITLSDTVTPTLTLTATTQSILTTDAAVLALINSSFKVAGVAAGSVANLLSTYSHIASVTVTDSLANVISNENALLTSQTTGITLSPLPTTAAALVYSDYNTDLTVLNKISSAYSLTVSAVSATNIASVLGNSHVSSITVSDSAANLAANLASNTPTLSTSITKITAITVSDSATLTLTLTAAQLTSYKNVLNLISTNGGTLDLTVTGVTLANLPSVFATTGVSHIAILDTAANVFSSSNLSSLLNDVTKISAITLSDTVTPTLTLTATTQSILTTDAAVLALINSSFKVAGVAAGSVANLLSTYSHIASVTVTDSLANVISNENALLTSQTTGITLSPLPTTAAALVYSDYNTDLTVLNKISSAYSLTVSAVSATNIASVLGNSHVSSITVSDSAANLAANLASNTPTLSTSITKITAITVSDSATLTLTLTAAQLTSYKNVLNLISTNGGTLNLTVTGVTLANLPSVFATTGVSHIAILDTAANVFSSSNLSSLLNDVTKISAITLSDTVTPTLTLTATTQSILTTDAAVLALINSSFKVAGVAAGSVANLLSTYSHIASVTVTDSLANVISNENALLTSQTTGITLSPLPTTAAALVYSDYNTDLTVLNKISSAYSLTVSAVSATNIASVLGNSHVSSITVSDSAANLAANLASNTPTLSTSITKITAITVSDSATLTLTLTAAQLTSYKNVLNLISTNGGTLDLTVTGVTLANLPSVFATTGVSHIAILDTAANVFSSSNLSSLLNDVTKISAITLSDTVTPTLTLTATTQSILTTDAAVLALINSSFKVAGVAAGSVANLLSTYSHIASVTVTDSLANVISNENALLTSQTTGITLSPLPTTAAALVYSDYNTDLTVLNKISSAYSLTVSAVSATNIASVLGNSHVSSITVSDSAANLAANLASNTPTLSTSITKITAITVSDSATLTLTLTAAQLTSYKNVLNLISTNGGTLNLTVTGVTLANLPSVFATTGVSHIAILDTAANVFSSSNLSSLLNDVTKISAITLSDTVTPTLTLTATTQSILTTDAAVLALINSSFKVAGVAAGSVANLLSTYSHIASVTVTDSLANVISNENALLTSQTTGITLSPLPTTAAALVYSDYNTDLTVLNKISSAYSLTVSAVSATNIASVLGNSHVSSITVSDSAANLAANLASNTPTLSTSITKITAITVSDSATLTLTLTAAQLTSYKNVLNLISTNGGTLNLTVTGVTLANLPSVFATTGVSHIAILDTAANVFSSSNLSSLLNDVTKISAITLSDTVTPTLTLTATTQSILTTDAAVLALINSSFKVAGVAAGSVANLLSTYSHIASVTVTDSLANVISNENALLTSQTTGITLSPLPTTAAALVYSDYNTDLTVLNKISSAYSLTVSAVSATNIASVLGNSHVSSITVSDSAANLAANLASNTPTLSTSITKITAITVSDSATLTLTLTAAQLTSYKNVLNLISTNGGTLNLTVTGVTLANLPSVFATTGVSHIAILDTAANVFSSSNLSSLLNDVTKISAITLSDTVTPTLTLTATTQSILTTDAAVLALINSSFKVAGVAAGSVANLLSTYSHIASVTVTDSLANVISNENALLTSQTTGITLSPLPTTAAALVYSDYNTDLTVLNKISSAYSLTVSAVSATNIASVLGNSHVSSITVSDSAANLAANLASNTPTLSTSITKITAITVSDSATLTLTLTAAQLTSYKNVLNLISTNGGTLDLTVTGVTLANLPSVFATTGVSHIAILDTAANVFSSSNLSSLLNDVTKISAITLSDTVTPTLTLTATTQSILTTDAAVLALINSSFKVAGVAAGSVANLLSTYSHIASVTVTDLAANVQADLIATPSNLESNVTKITSIILTDNGTPTITLAAQTQDTNVLALINSAFKLSGVTVSNISTVLGNSHLTGFSVSDSLSNVLGGMSTLVSDNSKLGSISLTDSGTVTINLSWSTYNTDSAVLSKINTPYSLTLASVPAASVTTALSNSHVNSIAIADTAGNVASNITTLVADKNTIKAIAITDTAANIISQFSVLKNNVANLTGLNITISDNNNPLNLTVTQISNSNSLLQSINNSYTLTVSDLASNIFNNLNALSSFSSQISSIHFTDTTEPTFTLTPSTQSQITSFANVFGLINSNFMVAGVTIGNVETLLSSYSHVTAVAIADSAASISTNFDGLQALATDRVLNAITILDSAPLTLSIAQILNDSNALAKISNAFSVAVTDNSTNISANLDALESLYKKNELSSITDTTSSTPISVSLAQITTDKDVLAKLTNYTLAVTDTSTTLANLLSDFTNYLEPNANHINNITLPSNVALTLTSQQYASNIDALAEISTPYTLNISNSNNALAPLKISPFIVRAPFGSSDTVTLTVNVSINGAAAIAVGTLTTNGNTPVEFSPSLNTQPGDQWTISVTASNANGSLGAGQIEIAPGFMGSTVSSSFGTGISVQFVSLSADGTITGLPSTYSATDNHYYVLQGDSTGFTPNLSTITAAFNSTSDPTYYNSLLQYLKAGRLIIDTLDGASAPAGNFLATPAAHITVGSTTYSVPVINENFDAQQGAILVNTDSSTNQGVEMYVTPTSTNATGGVYTSLLQSIATTEQFYGFNAPTGLTAGSYNLYFYDPITGSNFTNLQVAVSSVSGGAPSQWTTVNSIFDPNTNQVTNPISLQVDTVSNLEAYAKTHTNSNTWYIISDTTQNIQNAGSGLSILMNGSQHLIGAYPTDGFVNNSNAQPTALAVTVGSSVSYVRVLQDTGTNQQAYSVLALQTKDSSGNPLPATSNTTTYTVQFYLGGVIIGTTPFIIDGIHTAQAIQLPDGLNLTSGTLTAKLSLNGGLATAIGLGLVPAGGGNPSFTSAITLWAGSANQLPATVSAINSSTLYIILDTAQNIAALTNSAVETSVLKTLSANGQLAFDLSRSGDNQLSYMQHQLIEQSNVNIANVTGYTLADSLFALQKLPSAETGVTIAIHDSIAGISQLYAQAAAIYNSTAVQNLVSTPVATALTNGQIWLTDTLANLTNSQSMQSLTSINVQGIVVADSIADYQSQFSTVKTNLNTLATHFHTTLSYEVQDSVANLQAALTNASAQTQTNLQLTSVQIDVVDNVFNLQTAFNAGSFASLSTALAGYGDSNQTIAITAKDTVANLNALLNHYTNNGLYSHIHDVTVIDSANNINTALANQNYNNINPLQIANNIAIQDSYQNVMNETLGNLTLLDNVSTLILTSGANNGDLPIQILSQPQTNGNTAINLPDLILPFMSGTLTATEAIDSAGTGTLVTISDTNNHTVIIDFENYLDNSSAKNAFTQGGWYQIGNNNAGINPTVSSVSYDASTGILTLHGTDLSTNTNDYQTNDLTLTGKGGGHYTLTNSNVIGNPNSSSVNIQLSANDELAVNALFNQNGTTANDSTNTVYQLSASNGWDTWTYNADTITAKTITVSNDAAPTISQVSYNTATGTLTFSGTGFITLNNNNYNLLQNGFSIVAGNSTYNFTISNSDTFSNVSTTGFTVTLNESNEVQQINSLLSSKLQNYTFKTATNWDNNLGTATNQTLAITRQPYSALQLIAEDNSSNILPANTVIQFSENGSILTSTVSVDGTTIFLPFQLPADAISGSLTATATVLGATSNLNIGLMPLGGGGLPANFNSSINLWVGTVSAFNQLTLTSPAANTLYVVKDTAQNLEAFAAATSATGLAANLSSNGVLAYEVTNSELSYLQQQLIELPNLNFINVADTSTLSNSLLALAQVPQLYTGETMVVHDDLARLMYASNVNETSSLVNNTLTNNNVWLTDNLAMLTNTSNSSALNAIMSDTSSQLHSFSTLQGIQVADTLAQFEAQTLSVSSINTKLSSAYGTNNIHYIVNDTYANLTPPTNTTKEVLETAVLKNFTAAVNIVDSVSNLESAYSSSFSGLTNELIAAQDSSGYTLTAKDTIANLQGLFSNSSYTGLYTLLKNINIIDSAQNIANAIENKVVNNNALNPIEVANKIIISDSFDNVNSALHIDANLLGQISELDLTTGETKTEINNHMALIVNPGTTNNNVSAVASIPELVLSFMSGTLNATETQSGANLFVSISDTHADTVTIELVGVTDAALNTTTHQGTFTQGGWYHT